MTAVNVIGGNLVYDRNKLMGEYSLLQAVNWNHVFTAIQLFTGTTVIISAVAYNVTRNTVLCYKLREKM